MPRSRSMRPSSRGARCAALAGAMSHLLRSHPREAPAPSASWRSTHDPRRAITTRRSQACSESPVGRGRRRSRPACETNRKHPYGASSASGCSPTATRRPCQPSAKPPTVRLTRTRQRCYGWRRCRSSIRIDARSWTTSGSGGRSETSANTSAGASTTRSALPLGGACCPAPLPLHAVIISASERHQCWPLSF